MTHNTCRDAPLTIVRSDKLGVYAGRLYVRMKGRGLTLRCQSSETEKGARGGFVWWLDPGGYRVSPASAVRLAKSEFVRPLNDGLFDGSSHRMSSPIRGDRQMANGTLSQQRQAIVQARHWLASSGAKKLATRPSELEFVLSNLVAADRTLAWLGQHEAQIKAALAKGVEVAAE